MQLYKNYAHFTLNKRTVAHFHEELEIIKQAKTEKKSIWIWPTFQIKKKRLFFHNSSALISYKIFFFHKNTYLWSYGPSKVQKLAKLPYFAYKTAYFARK
jgi:hypothetical protein